MIYEYNKKTAVKIFQNEVQYSNVFALFADLFPEVPNIH